MGDKQKHHQGHKLVHQAPYRSPIVGKLNRKLHHHHGLFIDGTGADDLWKLALAPVILVLAILFLVSLVALLAGGWGMGPGMMGRMMGGPGTTRLAAGGAETGWPAAAWILIFALVADAAFLGWLAVSRVRSSRNVESPKTPLEMAQERYIKGEITLPEYEEMLGVLLEPEGTTQPVSRSTK